MSTFKNSLPFDTRYKISRLLHYGNPYSNYKTYNIKDHPENKTNILAIYVDNQACTTIPNNKPLVSTNLSDENTALLQSQLLVKYYVEIHYIPEIGKQKKIYIMTENEIKDLLSKYDL